MIVTVSIITLFLPVSPAAAAASWTCNLLSRPLEDIPISPEQQQEILRQQQQSQEGYRNLLRTPLTLDAIVVPVGQTEENQHHRQVAAVENSTTMSLFDHPTKVTTTTTSTTVYHEGRQCGCANNFLFNNGVINEDVEFYCPTPANQCSVWITRNGDDYDYGVRCFKNMSWAVTTARQLWYYIVFWFALLLLYPIFTRPGHVSVSYIIMSIFLLGCRRCR